jgi:hypothetical protein
MITVPWSAMKQIVDVKGVLQYIEDSDNLYVFLVDGNFQLTCIINKHLDKQSVDDFENNYKSSANPKLWQNDDDGAQIVRLKAAKKGWSFWAIPIEVTTSTIGGSLFCQDSLGNSLSWINCKIYDNSNDEITTPGLLDINLASCTKTVIDFEPTFDYEIIGGALRINSNPSQNIRLWIVGAPDIPVQYGGSKEFASGINLKFLAPDSSFDIDGRVTKFLTYNPETHQGKIRMILKHPAGLQINMQFVVHIYRQ